MIALAHRAERNVGRLLALVALLAWCGALFAPVVFSYPSRPPAPDDLAVDRPLEGWMLMLCGWLGPLFLAPGWFANIPFAITLSRYFIGLPPGKILVIVGLVLAITGLAPFRWYDFESGSHIWYYVRGLSFWLWFGACMLLWLPALIRLPGFAKVHEPAFSEAKPE